MSDEFVIAILASVSTAFVGAVIWICKNRCRNQELNCESPCCTFHTDSRLRATIRDEIERSRQSEIEIQVLDSDRENEKCDVSVP